MEHPTVNLVLLVGNKNHGVPLTNVSPKAMGSSWITWAILLRQFAAISKLEAEIICVHFSELAGVRISWSLPNTTLQNQMYFYRDFKLGMWYLPGKLSIGWQLTTGTRRTTWWPLPDPTPDRTLFKVVILSTLGLVIPLPLFWPWTASSNIHRLSKNSYYAHTRNLSLRKNQSPKEPRHPALYHWKSLQSHSAKLLDLQENTIWWYRSLLLVDRRECGQHDWLWQRHPNHVWYVPPVELMGHYQMDYEKHPPTSQEVLQLRFGGSVILKSCEDQLRIVTGMMEHRSWDFPLSFLFCCYFYYGTVYLTA